LSAHATSSEEELAEAVQGASVVIAAGATGVQLLPRRVHEASSSLLVAIDLNAVPPSGIEGVEARDRNTDREGTICYGALGVGQTKMKIHREAIRKLFTRNDLVLDAEEVFQLAQEVG
jgi:hypothetical protein